MTELIFTSVMIQVGVAVNIQNWREEELSRSVLLVFKLTSTRIISLEEIGDIG